MSFWEKTVMAGQPKPPEQEIQLDEEAMAEMQSAEAESVFDEEEEDIASLMADANLRLEQGRLYQMVLQGDIFADTDADPRAIKNVQREIRKFIRERLEVMIGIRQEKAVQETIVSSPFNDLEVTVLKMLASKMSKGATEEVAPSEPAPQSVPAVPKKDGISSISGNLRPQNTPLKANPKPIQKTAQPAKKAAAKTTPKEDESRLKKSIDEMTPEELAAHDAAAIAARSKNYAAMPSNLVPHPSPQQLEALYTTHSMMNPAPGSAVDRMTALINGRT